MLNIIKKKSKMKMPTNFCHILQPITNKTITTPRYKIFITHNSTYIHLIQICNNTICIIQTYVFYKIIKYKMI